MKIQRYIVIEGYDPDDLSDKVNAAIEKCWQPYGGMSFYPKIGLECAYFYQPMVLMESDETSLQEINPD